MSTSVGGIHVDLALNQAKLQAGLRSAKGELGKFKRDADSQFASIGKNFLKGLAAGAVAGGLTGIVSTMRSVVRETANLRNEAARAGVSLKVFQEWKVVAEQMRIPLDALVDAFKELNIRADEFATTGKGSAAEAFQRLGLSPQEVKERLADPAALMLELISRTQRLKDVAAGTRIFDELFGGTGAERLVTVLQAADGEIGRIIDSAHEAGRILDEEMIKRADDLDREFTALWGSFESAAKTAILNVSIALREGLVADIMAIGAAMRDLLNDPSLHNASRFLFGDNTQIGDELAPTRGMEARVQKLTDQVANLRDLGFDAVEAERELAIARADLDAEVARIMSGQGAGTIGATTDLGRIVADAGSGDSRPSTGGGGGGRRGGGGGRGSAADRLNEFEALAQRIREATIALEAENAELARVNPALYDYGEAAERARIAAELLTAAQKAGLTVTPELRARIDELAGSYAQATAAANNLAEAQSATQQAAEDFRALGKDVLGGFISDLRNGKSAAEALSNALDKVIDRMLDMALNSLFGGMGGGGALLGTTFSLNIRRIT